VLRRLRTFGSPVATHTICGFDCDTATPPSATVFSFSKVGAHVMPASVVFHKPLDVVAAQITRGSFSTTARSTMRVPVDAGPILRHGTATNGLTGADD